MQGQGDVREVSFELAQDEFCREGSRLNYSDTVDRMLEKRLSGDVCRRS